MNVKKVKSLLGYARAVCQKCPEKCQKVRWKVVVRKSQTGKDLWGLECSKAGLRLFNESIRGERK